MARRTSMSNMSSRRVRIISSMMFAIISATSIHAQEYRGEMIGRVTDPSGAVIPGAAVTAQGPQQKYTAKTNGSGDFNIPFVQPGTYDVSVVAQGFKNQVEKNVVIDVAQKVNLN